MKNVPLAFCLIAAGLIGIWASATNGVRHWPNLASMLKLCDAIFLSAGLTLLAAGSWLFLLGKRQRAAAVAGAAAAVVFVVALAAGIWSGVIPCSSPG